MRDFLSDLWLTLDVASHIVPIAITILVIIAFIVVKSYLPQFHYITLVSEATDEDGIVTLAKYMAKRNGGKHIDTDHCWEAFIPAARAVSSDYHH